VTDRGTEKLKGWANAENSIYYSGYDGIILFGNNEKGAEKISTLNTNHKLEARLDILVKVDRSEGAVQFILKGPKNKETREYKVESPILKVKKREFVPCFMMYHEGDSLTW
jgi:hypothetical protein